MKILYCIDERGLKGGAHIATELLIAALKARGHQVDVMEAIRGDSFWGYCRRAYCRLRPLWRGQSLPLFLRDPWGAKRRKMCQYETVCVMSETSTFSALVATLPPSVRKVQMIHTNYPAWARLVRRNAAEDEKVFRRMDCIACVGEIGAGQFAAMFPSCRGKVMAFQNLIDTRGLAWKEKRPHEGPVRVISLARIDDRGAKDGPRMIRVAQRLKDAGVNFVWDVYGGGGNGLKACRDEVIRLGLFDIFRIHGFDLQAREKIAEADFLAILSHYEGLPNVIYEALLSGTPVLATSVGGVPEQIEDGKTGWLVSDDEDAIVETMSKISARKDMLLAANKNLRTYAYDQEKVLKVHEALLSGTHQQEQEDKRT